MLYDELPIAQKAAMMGVCIKNGITNPDDIRTAYNNYVEGRNIFDGLSESYHRASAFGQFLADGGKIEKEEDIPPYTPEIDDEEQPGYRQYLWKLAEARRDAFLKMYGEAAPVSNYYEDFLNNSEGTFNYRRWYNLASPAEREYGLKKGLAHWRDADGKTALHPGFSDESPYSGYKNPYNPKGITGGSWRNDDYYEFSDSQMNNDWPINRTLEEFRRSREEEGSHTYGYYKGARVLPEITVTPKGNYFR